MVTFSTIVAYQKRQRNMYNGLYVTVTECGTRPRCGTAHSGPGPSSCRRSSPSARPPGCAGPLGLGQSTHFGFGPSTHFGGRSKYNSLPVAQLVIYFGSLRERDSVNRELEESWRIGRDWMKRELESYCEELAWSCFGSHTGYDLSGADKPPPHILAQWTGSGVETSSVEVFLSH